MTNIVIKVILSLVPVLLFVQYYDLSITSAKNFQIGIATLHLLDISKRITLMYGSIGAFALTFFLLLKFVPKMSVKKLDIKLSDFCKRRVLKFQRIIEPLKIRLTKIVYYLGEMEKATHYSIILPLSFGVYTILLYTNLGLSPLLMKIGVFLFICFFLFKMSKILKANKILTVSNPYYTFLPLSFLPLIVPIAVELSVILSNRTSFNVQWQILCVGLIGIQLIFTFFRLKTIRLINSKDKFFTWFVFSMLVFYFYSSRLYFNGEMFEQANLVLPLFRWYNYGEFPLIESSNSHFLSDFIYGWIYSIFNKYQGLDQFAYKFMWPVFHLFIAYKFLDYFYSRKTHLALITLFFLPAISLVFTIGRISYALVPFLLFWKYSEKVNCLNRFLLAVSIVFFTFLSADTGLGGLVGIICVVVFSVYYQRIHLKEALRLLVSVLGLYSIIGLFYVWICFKNGVPIVEPLKLTLSYMGSSQSYGYLDLIGRYLNRGFVHYYLFPLGIISITCYWLANLGKFKSSFRNQKAFVSYSLIFMVGYYLVNLPRGLVRHGLVERIECFISPFVYLGFGILIAQKYKSYWSRLIVFMLITAVLSFSTKVSKGNISIFSAVSLANKMFVQKVVPPRIEKPRISPPPTFKNRVYSDLKELMDTRFDKDSTFYDFSNAPMLYYFLERPVVGFADQTALTNHSLLLQDNVIDSIRAMKVPVIIYSTNKGSAYGHFDGVPNSIRHQKLSFFIHKNYSPYASINERCVWIGNNVQIQSQYELNDVCAMVSPMIDIVSLPEYLGNFEGHRLKSNEGEYIFKEYSEGWKLDLNNRADESDYISVEFKDRPSQKVHASLELYSPNNEFLGGFKFILRDKVNIFPLSSLYNWQKVRALQIRLRISDGIKLENRVPSAKFLNLID